MRYLRLCFAVTLFASLLGGSVFAQAPLGGGTLTQAPLGAPATQAPIFPVGQAPLGAPVTQAPSTTAAQAPATTVKLNVVLSRYEGDKKISSFPYTLSLVPGVAGSLRQGAEVPVASGLSGTSTAYTMQQVGSQVDATVNPTPDGKYRLQLSVTDRWFVTGTQAAQGGVPNTPSFRNVVSSSQAILSNGETMQFTSSADKASNETFKIDVTLTVGNK